MATFYYCDTHNIYYNYGVNCPICMLNERMDDLHNKIYGLENTIKESKELFNQMIKVIAES